MKWLAPPLLVLALFACSVGSPPPASTAAEGPARHWPKEGALQRALETPSPDAVISKPGDYSFTIQHDGRTRMYRVHVPAKYDPATPAPLLFALHGAGGNMDAMARDRSYGQITASEREGFVVVFPNGFSVLESGKFATWNAGNCCAAARDENVDDVGFIRLIVDNVTRQMSIDRNRIYATGMSNGGMLSYRLACEMSDVFKAIAPVAGTDNTRGCTPKNPVSILHIHARDDSHVLFSGGAGPSVRNKSKVTEFKSVAETVSKWARLNGCTAPARRSLEKTAAYCEVHSQCEGNSEVKLCVTETGGHSWPSAKQTRGEPAAQAISANDLMWDFFMSR